MFTIYRFLINLIFLLSPLILVFRLLKKKRILRDLKKNFVFFQKKEVRGNSYGFMGLVLEKYKV